MPLSPAPHLSSTLQMLEAVTASNNHNRDLSFVCSGISLSYHQSILFFHSPFLTNLLGSLACCKCEKAQCGRKEEVVIVLDKVEVGTVQGLMEYLYRGECVVKDRRGYEEMQKLVDVLGMKIKLEIKNKDNNSGKVAGSDASEHNLEETDTDSLPLVVNFLEEEQRRIAEDILKFIDKFCVSDEDQKCSKCDEWLSKENFMEHFKKHKEEFQSSLQTILLQKKLSNPPSLQKDVVSKAPVLPPGEINKDVYASENASSVANLEAKKTRVSERVLVCMEMFERGVKEVPCTECEEVIAKDELIEHYKNHVNQINSDTSEISNSKTKKRGPKIGGRTSEVPSSRVKTSCPGEGESYVIVTPPIGNDVKKQFVNEDGDNMQKSKSKGIKKKSSDIVSVTTEEVATDEYTCFNPTFKIKPGIKKVGKGVKSSPVVPVGPVPEIKLTFNLNDLGISQETIKLQDLSTKPQVFRKRKAGLVDCPLVKIEVHEKKREVNVKKKRKITKVHKSVLNVSSSLNRCQKTKEASCETNSDSSVATTTSSSHTFSLPSSTSCTSFPLFLRAVCGQADSVLPPGLDREHEELGRRVVHRLAGQRLQEGDDRQVTQDDVLKEMIDGIEDDEDLNNVSSDGSEAPLVMDLSEMDL